MPGVVLPSDGFESYAGSYVALAAVWDVYNAATLDNTAFGYTYWRLDDLNPVPPAARARCFLVA